jgi:TolA-binding protein
MKKAQWLFAPVALVAVLGWITAAGAEEATQTEATQEAAQSSQQEADEDWLNTVWTQVDDMVQEEDYKLQETVTVAAVRGAEAEDSILDKLYYRGGKRYPSQDKLKKAIDTLKKAIEQDPKAAAVPKQRFFIAQCHEKLGQLVEARAYYEQVTRAHPDTPWSQKSQERLDQMAAAE